jgi:osmoprotectant transport system substrate-binding protein
VRTKVKLLLIAFAFIVGACSSSQPLATKGIPTATTVVKGKLGDTLDLGGAHLVVGTATPRTDDATEVILAQILRQALEATGAHVVERNNLGNGFLERDALLSGEIEMYWAGEGTAWTVLLRQPPQGLDRSTMHDQLTKLDVSENGVAWLAPTRFEQAPAFAVGPKGPRLTKLSEIGDWLDRSVTDPVICVTQGFETFPTDGRVEFEAALGRELPDRSVRVFDPVPIYPATARGTCKLGLVETSNGRVPQYGLRLLRDDLGVFGPNYFSLAIRQDVLEAYPELASLEATIANRLDLATMQELNRRVVVEGQNPAAVARSWLRSEGLV